VNILCSTQPFKKEGKIITFCKSRQLGSVVKPHIYKALDPNLFEAS